MEENGHQSKNKHAVTSASSQSKKTIILLQGITLRTLKIQTPEIIAMYIIVDIIKLTGNGCSQLHVAFDNSTSVQYRI